MILIVDYGAGNLASVLKAFNYLRIPAHLSADPGELQKAAGLILPGVGAFGEGKRNLEQRGLIEPIKYHIKQGKPFLGICLGLQLLFSVSQEDDRVRGLDLIPGAVKKFSVDKVKKIPHIGWNQLELTGEDPLFADIDGTANFYFVHSFYVYGLPQEVILAKTGYRGQEFVSAIRRDNIWGIQAHPEKSSEKGLKVLSNFSKVVKEWK